MAKGHVELGFNSEPVNDSVTDGSGAAATDLTDGEITIALPTGAVIKKASLLCFLEYEQNDTNQITIDVDMFFAKSAEAYGAAVLSLSPGFGLSQYKGTSGEIVLPVDVSAKVDAVGTYKAKFHVEHSADNDVQYISCFVLIVAYSMA